MTFVRIIAEFKESGRTDSKYKIVILCRVSVELQISDGEWFGYVQNETEKHPFVLRNGSDFFYGGEEHWAEPTNIGSRRIVKGEYFGLFNSPHDTEKFEATYQIVSVHQYAPKPA